MQKQIENPMVVDSLWNDYISKPEPDGYYDNRTDEFVAKEHALDYALDALSNDDYTKERFIEDVTDHIVTNMEIEEMFLKWFYKKWERLGNV